MWDIRNGLIGTQVLLDTLWSEETSMVTDTPHMIAVTNNDIKMVTTTVRLVRSLK